jgi:hypothetical protein
MARGSYESERHGTAASCAENLLERPVAFAGEERIAAHSKNRDDSWQTYPAAGSVRLKPVSYLSHLLVERVLLPPG